MKFAMMSDTHYISRRMITGENDRELMLQPEVTEQAVRQALEENDVLFIIGDLTDSGDRYSHEDFVSFLREMKEKTGKKIYVTFATHDYHHHRAYVRKHGEKVQYKSCPWNMPFFDPGKADWKALVTDEFSHLSAEECVPSLVPSLFPEEIWEMYREFGPSEAYSVSEENMSYCLDLDEKTRCLMLNDFFRNEEALKDKSPTYSPSCFRWIKQMRDEAARDGKYIFICSHHPFMPAVPAHRIGAGKENRDMRSPVVGHTLADMGFNLAFSGHSHFCDVGYLESESGNIIWDITTPSVRFYPPAYREIDLDGENEKIRYSCVYIRIPENAVIEEDSLFEHYHREFYNNYYRSVTGSNAAVKKIMDKLTVGDIYFIVKGKARLSEAEYSSVKNLKVFDLIIETAFNMLTGDGKYTPDTPQYRILMPLCAKLDSIIDTQPFIDVKKKFLGGYSISEIIEPMLFNNYAPDRDGALDLTKKPSKRMNTPVYSSHAGEFFMGAVYAAAVVLSFSFPALTAAAIPVLTLKKKLGLKKNGSRPFYRYF